MIAVFCGLGGHALLGKAREIADETGERVAAFASIGSENTQKLIYLGADEVLVSPVTSMGEWVPTISKYISSEASLKVVIFPSGIFSNALMGMIYATIPEKISVYLEDVTDFSTDGATKKFYNSLEIVKGLSSERTALISVDKTSVSEPFEDTARFGKTKTLDVVLKGSPLPSSDVMSQSETLVVLLGSEVSESTARLANRVAEKYRGVFRVMSGKVQIVYGPCLAVEVQTKLRDLPEFRGELISISRKKLPIDSISELAAITPDLDRLLQSLS